MSESPLWSAIGRFTRLPSCRSTTPLGPHVLRRLGLHEVWSQDRLRTRYSKSAVLFAVVRHRYPSTLPLRQPNRSSKSVCSSKLVFVADNVGFILTLCRLVTHSPLRSCYKYTGWKTMFPTGSMPRCWSRLRNEIRSFLGKAVSWLEKLLCFPKARILVGA